MSYIETAVSTQKEKPCISLAASRQGHSKKVYNIYTEKHLQVQASLKRKYGLNRAWAILTADMLLGDVNE